MAHRAGETSDPILVLYLAETARSREITAAAALDDRPRRPGSNQTLAWILILCHRIQEVPRHNGHADILRELIDGHPGA